MSAGSRAVLRAEGVRRGSPFSVRPVGGGRPLPDGRVQTGTLRLRIPSGARTGLYVVRVNSRGRRAAAPLAVAGRPVGGGSSARPLVVLPVVGWQGSNPFDDRFDGQPDDLLSAGRAPLFRPYAAGLPLGARSQAAPLLAFLDDARLPYDLTTDLSLARRRGPLDRSRPRRWPSRATCAGTSLWSRGGCAAMWTTAAGWRCSGRTRSGGRCDWRATS